MQQQQQQPSQSIYVPQHHGLLFTHCILLKSWRALFCKWDFIQHLPNPQMENLPVLKRQMTQINFTLSCELKPLAFWWTSQAIRSCSYLLWTFYNFSCKNFPVLPPEILWYFYSPLKSWKVTEKALIISLNMLCMLVQWYNKIYLERRGTHWLLLCQSAQRSSKRPMLTGWWKQRCTH